MIIVNGDKRNARKSRIVQNHEGFGEAEGVASLSCPNYEKIS